MAELNFRVSNGTCYFAAGERANDRFIPCGNEVFGHKACCESQDMCLSSNACYNGQYGVTYLAGCTDEEFGDASCPDKGVFEDHPWAGLVYCNGTSNEWIACEDFGETVGVPQPCWCPSTSRTVAFADASTLRNIISLPTALGETVSWADVDAFETESSVASSFLAALSTSDDSSMSPTTSTPSTTSLSPTSTPTDSPPDDSADSGGLSTGAKIAIPIGVIAALAIVGVVIYFILRRRRNARHNNPSPAEDPVDSYMHHRPSTLRPLTPEMEMRSPAWSGNKSELPADESTSLTPAPSYRPHRPTSEVEGSPVIKPRKVQDVEPGLRKPGDRGTYYELPG